jgi:choline dehydrogenase-like flavoprotein
MSVGRTVRPDQPAAVEPFPGVSCMAEVLRPTSEGSVWITSPDPDASLKVDPNYLDTEYDRTTTADLLRRIRQLFAQSPLADRIDHEIGPGPEVQTDEEIVDAVLNTGTTGSHAVATCAMGPATTTSSTIAAGFGVSRAYESLIARSCRR